MARRPNLQRQQQRELTMPSPRYSGSAKQSSTAVEPMNAQQRFQMGDTAGTIAPKKPNADTKKTYDKLYAEANRGRDPWIQLWQEIYNYTLPQREHFYQKTPGQQRTALRQPHDLRLLPAVRRDLLAGLWP
jgi:hypothetical protein